MPAYTCINRVLNVFDAVCAVYSLRSLYKSLSSYRDREIYSEHSQTFKMESFAKTLMSKANK